MTGTTGGDASSSDGKSSGDGERAGGGTRTVAPISGLSALVISKFEYCTQNVVHRTHFVVASSMLVLLDTSP